MPLVLIDGDEVLFKGAAVSEQEVRWDEQNHVLYSNEERTFQLIEGMINRLCDRFDARGNVVVCFSGKQPYFREQIAPGYKAGRGRKPLCYAAVKERVASRLATKEVPGLEADDVIGILATKPGNKDHVIVSQDKDMKTLPATVWNGKDLITYSEAEADYWHLFQTLTGDTVDGYGGCPAIGPVKAEKLLRVSDALLQHYGGDPQVLRIERWAAVKKAYEKAGLTEEHALIQARLARILRWSDWDNKKKEPILWNPYAFK